ncbi:MAG: transposase [Pseudomonadota bacterium]
MPINVYCGNTIWPHDQDAMEKLARYIIHAAFSQERMNYITADQTADGIVRVIYQSKNKKSSQTFQALDWLAQLTTHIPDKREYTVRYYGYYSNKSRGLRKKAGTDDDIPAVINSGLSPKEFRKS